MSRPPFEEDEPMSKSQITTRILRVGTVAIPVRDPERALNFYVGTLGLDKRLEAPLGQGQRWIEVAPEGAATTIALAPPGDVPVGVDTGIRLYADDCEATHEALRVTGADVGEIQRWPGVPPMFSFRDPDGNTLYLVEAPAS
jgi:predicted enzyme related to lactoylglutathione lyase